LTVASIVSKLGMLNSNKVSVELLKIRNRLRCSGNSAKLTQTTSHIRNCKIGVASELLWRPVEVDTKSTDHVPRVLLGRRLSAVRSITGNEALSASTKSEDSMGQHRLYAMTEQMHNKRWHHNTSSRRTLQGGPKSKPLSLIIIKSY